MTQSVRPILYSFRRCPYAIRARLAILASGQPVELREVVLRDKPPEMLAASPKGTVPVLLLGDGNVIDESLDIMLWALGQHDPHGWLGTAAGVCDEMLELIATCETDFKPQLDAYKYGARDDDARRLEARERAGDFLDRLEARLREQPYLFGEAVRLGDVAIFPFARQFAFVDKAWFDAADWGRLTAWLDGFLGDRHFLDVMVKVARWEPGQGPVLFGTRDMPPVPIARSRGA